MEVVQDKGFETALQTSIDVLLQLQSHRQRERARKLERESAGTGAGAVQQRRFSRERIWREKGKIVTSRIVSSQSRKSRF